MKRLKTLYLELQQKASYVLGRTYQEKDLEDAFGTGTMNEVIRTYYAIDGTYLGSKIIPTEQSREAIKKDISGLLN